MCRLRVRASICHVILYSVESDPLLIDHIIQYAIHLVNLTESLTHSFDLLPSVVHVVHLGLVCEFVVIEHLLLLAVDLILGLLVLFRSVASLRLLLSPPPGSVLANVIAVS